MIRRLAVALGVASLTAAAYGQTTVPLQDSGAGAGIQFGSGGTIANTGAYMLQTNRGATTVDDLLHLVKQGYYYRIGSSGGETDLFSGAPTSLVTYGTNAVEATYPIAANVSAVVRYDLKGGPVGSFTGTLSRSLTIVNTSASAIDFHLFDFTDLNLTGMTFSMLPNGTYVEDAAILPDQAKFTTARSVSQWDEWYSTPVTKANTTVNVVPTRVELATGSALRTSLEDGAPTTLAFASGSFPTGVVGGNPGDDVSFAFQWDVSIAPNSALRISGATAIVPEPGSIALLAGGVALLFGWRRRTA